MTKTTRIRGANNGFPKQRLGVPKPQGFVNGGFHTVVRACSGEQIPARHFNLNFNSVLPLLYLFKTSFFYIIVTPARLAIPNHGLETTVYRLLETWLFQTWLFAIFTRKRSFALFCALLRSQCALLRTCVFALLLRRPRMSGRRMSGTSRRFPSHFLNCDFPWEMKEKTART